MSLGDDMRSDLGIIDAPSPPASLGDSMRADLKSPSTKSSAKQPDPTILDAASSVLNGALGVGETALHAGSAALGATLGGFRAAGVAAGDMLDRGEWIPSKETSADALQKAHELASGVTYEPRTETGQALTGTLGSAFDAITQHRMPGQRTLAETYNPRPDLVELGGAIVPAVAPVAAKLAGRVGAATTGTTDAGAAALDQALGRPSPATAGAAAATDAGAVSRPPVQGADPLAVAPYASGGSAAATIGTQATAASPQLVQALRQSALAAKNGQGTFNAAAAERHIVADRLGVQLSEGQATGSPQLISEELNSRKELGTEENYHAQDQQLGNVLTNLRDKVGPDVFASDPVGLGQILLDAKKEGALADNARVGTKYQALQDAAKQANLPNMGIDTDAMFANIDQALKDKLLTHHVPDALTRTLEGVKDGTTPLTPEAYESLRSQLSTAQREGNGSERAAAGVIRDQLEAMPMTPEAAHLKGLADDARQTAAQVFAKQDPRRLNTYDPAYADAARDLDTPIGSPSPLAATFVQKHVLGANPVYMQRSLDNLKAAADSGLIDPATAERARQTAAVSMLEELKNKAKVGDRDKPFAADGFNNTLKALQPKLGVFDSDTADTLNDVSRVSGWIKDRPTGNWVNNSNTAVDQRSPIARGASALLSGGIQYIGDTAVPLAKLGTKFVQGQEARAAQRAAEDRVDKQWGPAAGTLTRPQ
jgi:hypothetical protein